MKTLGILFFLVAVLASSPALAQAPEAPEVGDHAPDFVLEDSKGKEYKLSDFKGKNNVVIEFFRSGGW